ncbi:hypothetical protein IAR55_003039 [Kwoniella newhampshirensis]|uniref:Pentatricopeptide repeat-containing protein-mitochondrial domain-containing protein n=1 Tax=Kwoniella newhampshirensis TaxID=1651941 RepID=A0AAW0YZP1_9TREE
MSRLCQTCRSLTFASRRSFATASVSTELPPKRPRSSLPRLGRRTPATQSLPSLLKTLAELKSKSRRPTPSAYITIIKSAGDYALGRSATDGDETDSLGWQVAMAAWEDAKRGGLDLGAEGYESLMRARVRAASSSSNPEQTILLLVEMLIKDMTPPPTAVKTSIRLASMLNAAGRWGRPDLASTLLESLPTAPQEQHLAPLLEAFCNAGQVPNAFHVLSSIRDAGLTPTLATVQPIVAVLKNAEVIDQAFYALEDMHKAGQPVDIAALNALIEASARSGDLQRVRATQMAAGDLGLSPNIDTFNLVLSCCITTRYRPLGDTVLSEMVAHDIAPNSTSYENMVLLCLTQATYEDAFYYLEKTKSDGFKPSYAVYEALMRKCVTLQDSRWRLVMDEMKAVGYRMDSELHEFINSGGKTRGRDEKGRRRANDEMVGTKRRRWIGQDRRGAESS